MFTYPLGPLSPKNIPVVWSPTYGWLYNQYALTGMAPSGWHVPTIADWDALITTLGASVAGGYTKEAGLEHWASPNTGADDNTGLTMLPGGYRGSIAPSNFADLTLYGYYWSTTDDVANYKLIKYWSYDTATIEQLSYNFKNGLSVRLVKDDSTDPGTITDLDGNVYNCITIGTQVWIRQNWKCTQLADGTPIPTVTDGTTWAGLTTLAKCAYNNDEGNV